MGQFVRILIILFAVWLAIHLIKRALHRLRSSTPSAQPVVPRMLPCARCGVHVLETGAAMRDGKAYCDEHRHFAAPGTDRDA